MSTLIPTSSPLALLPARARQAIYVGYGVLVVVVSGIQVGYAAVAGLDQPTWLTVTLAVVGFLAVPVSALAATNVGQGTLDASEHPDVIAYQTGSGLPVAGPASPIPTGTPVDVTTDVTTTVEQLNLEAEMEPNEEYPAWDGKS